MGAFFAETCRIFMALKGRENCLPFAEFKIGSKHKVLTSSKARLHWIILLFEVSLP